jgi:hypothetical protein
MWGMMLRFRLMIDFQLNWDWGDMCEGVFGVWCLMALVSVLGA